MKNVKLSDIPIFAICVQCREEIYKGQDHVILHDGNREVRLHDKHDCIWDYVQDNMINHVPRDFQ